MKLVVVEWVDSHGPNGNPWLSPDDVPGIGELLECRSVGWVISDDDAKAVTLVAHRHLAEGGEDSGYTGVMTIPKCCIVRMTEVTES